MIVAVTYDPTNEGIFQHFGKSEYFKIYQVEEGKIVESQVLSTNGQGHGALAGVLENLKADVLICGGIGGGAQVALASAGIDLYGGFSGNADAVVKEFTEGKLEKKEVIVCNHHDHHHSEGCCK